MSPHIPLWVLPGVHIVVASLIQNSFLCRLISPYTQYEFKNSQP